MQTTKKLNIHHTDLKRVTPLKSGFDQPPLKLVPTKEQIFDNTVRDKVMTRKRKTSQHPLRDLRLKSSFTLEELAELTEMSPSYLSRLESGTRRLNADILQRLSIALSCNPAELLPYTNPHVVSYVDHKETVAPKIKVVSNESLSSSPAQKINTQKVYSCDQITGSEILTYANRKASQIITDTAKLLYKDANVLVIQNDEKSFIAKILDIKRGQFADQPVHLTLEFINNENSREQCQIVRNSVKAVYCIIGHIEAE